MDSENETRPLLPSFQNESWRSRARKKCMRIPSEITITGIILGLFLIVVTLLIVLQNMESDTKDGISLDKSLLASPLKYNKKIEENSWQAKKDMQMENKERKWDKVNKGWKILSDLAGGSSWQEKKEMQMKNKERKLDNINKGWKKFPDISGGSTWQEKKEMQMKNKERKLDKINKDWKKFPDISGKTLNHYSGGWLDKEIDEIETLGIPEITNDYGKEVDDSLESFQGLQMSDTNLMEKFNADVLEIKKLLHSSTKWKEVDDGWKTLSEQGWKDNQIRKALFRALKRKRLELKAEAYPLQSPKKFDEIWDDIIENWKKIINEGKDDVENQDMDENKEADHQKIDWKDKTIVAQSPKATIKKLVREDEGWQKLSEQGWKNKDIEQTLIDAWIEKGTVLQSPMNIQSLFGKATDFFKNLFQKGDNNQKSQMKMNDEWASKFNLLQSPMSSDKKKKKIEELKNKHSKNGWKDTTKDETEHQTALPFQSSMDIEDILNIIEVIKEIQKDWKDTTKGETELQTALPLQSSMGVEDILHIIETIKEIQKERNSHFGRNDGSVTPNPKDNTLQYSIALDNDKREKLKDGLKAIVDEGWKDKILKEAIDKAWKDGNKLLESAMGSNDMKWKKVNNGWKQISNKS